MPATNLRSHLKDKTKAPPQSPCPHCGCDLEQNGVYGQGKGTRTLYGSLHDDGIYAVSEDDFNDDNGYDWHCSSCDGLLPDREWEWW